MGETRIIRRRPVGVTDNENLGPRHVVETRVNEDGSKETKLFLPKNNTELYQALVAGAMAIERKTPATPSTLTRREHQNTVYTRVGQFLAEQLQHIVENPEHTTERSRVVLPPRTGKTVIMGEIIATAGTAALILVPNLALAEKHRQNLAAQLPGVSIGLFTGNEKTPQPNGITIATYQSIANAHKKQKLPDWLKYIPFVFADEGHQAMTELRDGMLAYAFDPLTVRMAFTATPDYSEEANRTLATYFPHLIHEMTIREALDKKLLATPIVEVHQVDADASPVTIREGDYDQSKLGEVMNNAPIFEHALRLRMRHPEAGALITCSSIAQAEAFRVYFNAHREGSVTGAEMIIGETSETTRKTILDAFEAYPGQTIIVVGTLIQGWDSPRCKVLVDLGPSCSKVKSTQKYFRPLTLNGDAQGYIYVLLPDGLRENPLLPADVIDESIKQTRFDLPEKKSGGSASPQPKPTKASSDARYPLRLFADVKSVQPVATVIATGLHGKEPVKPQKPLSQRPEIRSTPINTETPRLLSQRPQDIRKIIATALRIADTIPKIGIFQKTSFRHALFTGLGQEMLVFLNITNEEQYKELMTRLYPEIIANTLLLQDTTHPKKNGSEPQSKLSLPTIDDDVRHILAPTKNTSPEERPDQGWRALFGPEQPSEREAKFKAMFQKILARAERMQESKTDLVQKKGSHIARQLEILELRYVGNKTYTEIAASVNLSHTRVAELAKEGLEMLRKEMRNDPFFRDQVPSIEDADSGTVATGPTKEVATITQASGIEIMAKFMKAREATHGTELWNRAKHSVDAYINTLLQNNELKKIQELKTHSIPEIKKRMIQNIQDESGCLYIDISSGLLPNINKEDPKCIDAFAEYLWLRLHYLNDTDERKEKNK